MERGQRRTCPIKLIPNDLAMSEVHEDTKDFGKGGRGRRFDLVCSFVDPDLCNFSCEDMPREGEADRILCDRDGGRSVDRGQRGRRFERRRDDDLESGGGTRSTGIDVFSGSISRREGSVTGMGVRSGG